VGGVDELVLEHSDVGFAAGDAGVS
jgi:hypothetical protein